MDLLITLVVFVVGFMLFGALFFGLAKFVKGNKGRNNMTYDFPERNRSFQLKVNKSHGAYSFK